MIIPVVAAMGERLCAAARVIGGEVDFDPVVALSRAPPLARSCRLVEAADGWIAVNLAREEDIAAVPAWTGCALDGELWGAIEAVARDARISALLEQAHLLGMPVAGVGECSRSNAQIPLPRIPELVEGLPFFFDCVAEKEGRPSTSSGIRGICPLSVLDLSALWAGPYCGGLLAEAGLSVTKVESQSRPDPTPQSDPALDKRLNGRKPRMSLDFSNKDALARLASQADILITSARPHALARLGLTEESLFACNPDLIWVAITAHGWHGDAAMRVGFGDDCAAAGGLVEWRGGVPNFIGDALADPLTGIAAATLAMEAVAQGQTGLIDVALARVAAEVAHQAGLSQ